jgi:AraC-like DNA-binding protein
MKNDIWIFRNDFPQVSLPFYPRGAGVNFFGCNRIEEHVPQEFCEVCWVAQGSCLFDFGNVRAELSAGQSIYRLPGERRYKRVTGEKGAVIYYVTFDGKNAADFIQSFGYPRQALDSGECPVLLFERIIRGLSSPEESDYRKLCALYTDLFIRMGGKEEKLPSFVRECLHAIRINCTFSDFDINQLADKLGVHRSTVSRTVKEYTGVTAQQFLENCRMEYALELLRNSTLDINTISSKTGFKRANYFCRVIKEKFGTTPAKLREKLK